MTLKTKVIGAQGEITIYRCEGDMPEDVFELKDKNDKGLPIISHSENGNHHVLDRPVKVMEQRNTPEGMRIFYSFLDKPTNLIQDASDAHEKHSFKPGLHQFRVARMVDPFTKQIQRVMD